MSFRPNSRLFAAFARNNPFSRQVPNHIFKRRVQTAAEPAPSGFAKFWNSPVGPKTVHFWAPVLKWCVVLTGVSDFARPASSLSLTQNLALMSTGAIWTRWCFIIKPRNIALAAVNFFLGVVGFAQVGRILMYRRSLKEGGEQVEGEVSKGVKEIESVAKDVVGK
ncbi:UPF0041-domain-containing protein [Delitschia confertaspora ATCC 74209]|uniref:Mitochondrial pyruvate carrier n=1 Tax=Delitschia confertaspora ATCC 74209 TaxID=1513339 RepID=A0A9P4JDJ7_9PLEO|nr:UPF0041-domain-containing protein [Delitschia confertaspora ATCC 74209]